MDIMFNKPKISFYATVPGLHLSNPIQKSVIHIPKWFKNIKPVNDEFSFPTIKTCPGFIDYFKQGYVVSLWCDLILDIKIINEEVNYNWSVPDKIYKFEIHSNNQFLDHTPPHIKKKTKIIFKPICPWKIVTPKGYSVFQMPMYYNYNPIFEVLPGVLHTDVYHTINQQMCIFKEGKFIIKKGTPLATYIPFKREEFDFEMTDNKNLEKKINAQTTITNSTYRDKFKNLIKVLNWKN